MPDVNDLNRGSEDLTPEERAARQQATQDEQARWVEEWERQRLSEPVPLPGPDPIRELEALIERASDAIEVMTDVRDQMEALADRLRDADRLRRGLIPPEDSD